MEYTIYNESLVYYALKDKNTGKYYNEKEGGWNIPDYLPNCSMIESLDTAKLIKDSYKNIDYEIRKVKVIDIGEVNDN